MHTVFAKRQINLQFKFLAHILNNTSQRKTETAPKVEFLNQWLLLTLNHLNNRSGDIVH